MVLYFSDLGVKVVCFNVGFQGLFIGGASRYTQYLAIQVIDIIDARVLACCNLGAGNEGGWQVGHLLLTGQVVGRGAAFQINRAIGHQGNTGLACDGHKAYREVLIE